MMSKQSLALYRVIHRGVLGDLIVEEFASRPGRHVWEWFVKYRPPKMIKQLRLVRVPNLEVRSNRLPILKRNGTMVVPD